MKKTCVICGMEFEAGKGVPGRHKRGARRRENAVTCSPRCSRRLVSKHQTKAFKEQTKLK